MTELICKGNVHDVLTGLEKELKEKIQEQLMSPHVGLMLASLIELNKHLLVRIEELEAYQQRNSAAVANAWRNVPIGGSF